MAEAALSIKLRCASWQQLATIYKRDISKGTMFLKAASPPAVGTKVRIDLTLPSASVITLSGTVTQHVSDPQRGSGVDLTLEPLASSAVWLIESALAAESKVRASTNNDVSTGAVQPIASQTPSGGVPIPKPPAIEEGVEVASAEHDLVGALVSEAESLRKLNPFLVLGVGYEAGDAEVRAAFGELTKRYHPDRFARYESADLRKVAAEIFILIRDAYRKLVDEASRQAQLQALGRATMPRGSGAKPPPVPRTTGPVRVPAKFVGPDALRTEPGTPPGPPPVPRPPTPLPVPAATAPTQPIPPARPTPQPPASASQSSPHVPPLRAPTPPPVRAQTQPGPDGIADGDPRKSRPGFGDAAKSQPRFATPPHGSKSVPGFDRAPPEVTSPLPAQPDTARPVLHAPPSIASAESGDTTALEAMLDEGRFDEAVAAYKLLAKKHPQDRAYRAGIELCEGLRFLDKRDRLEAAQRFEQALEIDPSNERAARELAEMRRQATNERKGLLSRLMGKKES